MPTKTFPNKLMVIALTTVFAAPICYAETPECAQNTTRFSGMSDNEYLARQVWQCLIESPEVESVHVNAIAENGQIKLYGHVLSEDNMRDAIALAEKIAGKNKVKSELFIIGTAPQSIMYPTSGISQSSYDAQAAATLQSRYATSDKIDERHLGVNVKNGRATITGIVPSRAQKEEALRIARDMESIDSVDSEIYVYGVGAFSASGNSLDGMIVQNESDHELNEDVLKALRRDTDLVSPHLSATTNDGIVKLFGHVNSKIAKEKAIESAKGVPGVLGVDSELFVIAQQGHSESTSSSATKNADRKDYSANDNSSRKRFKLARRVTDELIASPKVDAIHITVITDNVGTVSLFGHVQNEVEKRNAVDIAKNIDGVDKVKSNLFVIGARNPNL